MLSMFVVAAVSDIYVFLLPISIYVLSIVVCIYAMYLWKLP